MDEPNPNSPANSLAAQLYQENRREYEKRVQQIVEQSWLNFAENESSDEKKPEEEASTTRTQTSTAGSESGTSGARTRDEAPSGGGSGAADQS